MANEIMTPAKALVQWDNLPETWRDGLATAAAASVLAALQRYGTLRSREVVGGFVGDDTRVYELSAVTPRIVGWDEDSSEITRVDYPFTLEAGDDYQLAADQWKVVLAISGGKHLLFTDSTPLATETIRITFSAPWTEALVPLRDRPAVTKLAAAGICRALAARRAQTGESTLGASISLGPSETDNWLRLARDYEKAFAEEMGAGADTKLVAAVDSVQLSPVYDEDW